MGDLTYFFSDAVKHKARVHQLYITGELLRAKVKNRIFVKLDSIYEDYFQYIQITLEDP